MESSEQNRLDEVVKDMVESLKGPIEQLGIMQQNNLILVTDKVERTIQTQVTSEFVLGHLFDELLELTYWYSTEMYDLYYKLLNYVRPFNKELADDYEEFYLEIVNGEEIPLKKELKPNKE